MREISANLITEKVKEACIAANCRLPEDVLESFRQGKEREQSPLGRQIFDKMQIGRASCRERVSA